MKTLILSALLISSLPLAAQVSQTLNYQGRVAVNGAAFTGTGQFLFALVDAEGTVHWSSHATATSPVSVVNGLYSVRLGDTTLPNMAAVPSAIFSNADLRLRVLFDDGVNGLQILSPDQRLAPVGYAHRAATADSAATVVSVPASAIAPDSIQPSHMAHSLQTGAASGLAAIPAAGGVLNVTFPQPFETPPAVTLDGTPVPAANVTATGFTLTIPPRNLIVDDGTPATIDVGLHRDVMLVQGNPAICYTDSSNGVLKYVRATNAQGTAWGPPVVAASGGVAQVGAYCSMTLVTGNVPAIAYYDATNKDLKFVRALDVNGAAWAAPVIVASHATDDLGKGCILRNVVIGVGNIRPFIAYLDATAGTLKVAKANSSDGATWSVATPVAGLTGLTDATGFDLLFVSGPQLVIPYFDPALGQVQVVESASLTGNTWNAPRTITDSAGTYTGLDAYVTDNGNAALSWVRQHALYHTHIPSAGTLVSNATPVAAREGIPFQSSRIVPGNRPAAVFRSGFVVSYVESASADGLSWGEDSDLGAGSDAAPAAVRLADGSVLAVFHSPQGGGQLRVGGAPVPLSGTWEAGLPSPLLAAGVVDGSIDRAALAPGFFGNAVRATGSNAFAVGYGTSALGNYSWASGYSSAATADGGTAMGFFATASGLYSSAIGVRVTASGDQSTALGSDTTASGTHATAMGDGTTASGNYSTAMGFITTASGYVSTAMGRLTTASGAGSTAMGLATTASGNYSTAMGHASRAETYGEVSLGFYPLANTGVVDGRVITDVLLEVGNGVSGTPSNALTIFKDGRMGLDSADTNVEVTHLLTLPNINSAFGGQGRANAWTTYSDSRIKTEQRPISYGLREIMRLQPRAYTQHSGCMEHGTFVCEDEKGGSAPTIGFIAQEVEQVIPEAVQKPQDPANQLYGMDYEKLIPVLVKATQELKSENDTLKAQLAAMQQRLEKLERPVRRK